MDELENILNGDEQPETVEAQPEPQEAPAEEQPRGPDGKFAPKGNDGAMPAPEDEAKQVPIGSYKAEKEKRQALEAQIEQLRREVEAARQPAEPPAPPPSIWEDDQAALGHVHNSAVSQAVQQATFNARLDMSEMMARQAFSDFDEMKGEFVRMMQENPALQQQALADAHPWQRAYQIAKNARTMNELGATNLDELKAKLLEQIKAEQAQQPAAQITLPRSLADAQSARTGTVPAPAPLTLEEIFGR
jgi:hypothetical protein